MRLLQGRQAIGLIKKYSKGISFASEMGVQAEVEKELERLLCSWIPQRKVGKKSVVLYIEDLDRCKSERMVSVIDSLRTVLENPAIRHIYFRCILAMNILHALGDKMTKEVINQIIQHSYGYEMELKHSDTYIGGYVVDMVVPYEYPVKDGDNKNP